MPGVTVGVLDAELRVTDAAGSWLERTGLSSADVAGRPLAEVAGPVLAEQVAPAVRSALAGRSSRVRLRNPVRAVDPEAPEWIEIGFSLGEPEAGEPRVFWVLRDITGEQRLGTALSTAEQRLAMLGDDVRGPALFTLDVDGIVTGWGPGSQRLFGAEPQDIAGRHLSRLFPADATRRGFVHGLLRQAGADGAHRVETLMSDIDRRPLRCELTMRVMRDRQSDPVGFAVLVRDLTAHDWAAATIAMREQMYRAAFDDAPSGMALVERHPDGRWDVLEANTALASLVGHPVSALVGGSARLRTRDDLSGGIACDVFDLAPLNPGRRYEVGLLRADGTCRQVVVGLSPLQAGAGNEPGGTTRYVAQFLDVTARRDAERASAEALAGERRAGAELRELQRQRADFLATVSHELRTPLSSVLGFVELLTDGDLGALEPPQARALDAIARNSQRLRDLVEDLLVMSSIEQGSRLRAPARTVLGDVLDVALERVRPDAQARGITLRATPVSGLLVDVEPTMLRRVLLALLTNAVKFTGPGGAVGVEVDLGAGQVELAVVDDGVGIAPADLARVFDPFFRSAASERLATSGTGLGLSFVRRVVEMHGGQVFAESVPGVRTRFVVSLPVAVATAGACVAVPVGGAA